MKTIRIFIGSPGDVHEEREKARKVVNTLQHEFEDRILLQLVVWEDLALSATDPFQIGIEGKLRTQDPIDISVFVFWSRLGSPLSEAITRRDGTLYQSGTEREFDFMLELVEEGRRNQREGPEILVYFRNDDKSFMAALFGVGPGEGREEMFQQQKLLGRFREENFQDAQARNTRAYYQFEQPVEFAALLHKHLQASLDQRDLEGRIVWQEAPYRGLEVFDVHHAPIFRGREEEILDLHKRLRVRAAEGCAFVCIVGASGSGKSSLARAGLAAKLLYRSYDETVKEWRFALLQPGGKENLFASLVDCLAASPETGDELFRLPNPLPALAVGARRQKLQRYLEAGNAEAARELLEQVVEAEEESVNGKISVLLVLDQMEELWSDKKISPEPFLQAVEILAHYVPGFAVLATLRSDFYAHAQESPAFLRLKGDLGHFDLTRPGEAALREIIEKPARTAGLMFERDTGGALNERILKDALHDPGALPLLEYALDELHQLCMKRADKEDTRGDGASPQPSFRHLVLTNSAYDEIGKVEGAITTSAKKVFEGLSAETQAALPELLPLLVSVESGSGEEFLSVRLRPRLADLTGADPRSPRAMLTEALVTKRFLTTDNDKGFANVTLTHEALLKRWSRISEWIQHNRECLRIRSQVAQAHVHWKAMDRDSSLLLPRGVALEEGRRLLEEAPHLLKAEGYEALADFIRRSIEADFKRELASGTAPEELSRDLKRHHPAIWDETLRQALAAESEDLRRNTARLLRGTHAAEFQEPLIQLVMKDANDKVKLAAAQALISIEEAAPFDLILRECSGSGASRLPANVRTALARLVSVSDMEEKRPRFADWFARLPSPKAVPAQCLGHMLRLRDSLPVFLFVLIPAILFAMAGAVGIKWLPSLFNYSCVQDGASAFRGLFAATPAGFLIGGGTVLGLTFYRMVIGREYGRLSMVRPFPALLYGGVFALVAGVFCVFMISLVFTPRALYVIGWTKSPVHQTIGQLFDGLFVSDRCGYAFPVTCVGLGLAMAMMTNGLRASTVWPEFLDKQCAVTSLPQAMRITRGIVKLSLRYAWPIVVLTPLFAGIGLVIMQGGIEPKEWHLTTKSAKEIFLGGMATTPAKEVKATPPGGAKIPQAAEDPDERMRIWKRSLGGRALGLFGDVLSKVVGGYFAIVGMGLGIVMLRHGVRVDPQRGQR